MNLVDIVLGIILLIGFYSGFKKGLFVALASLIGTVLPISPITLAHSPTFVVTDANALAAAIKLYITNSDLLEQHSKGIRERINNNYSLEAVLPELLNIYKD